MKAMLDFSVSVRYSERPPLEPNGLEHNDRRDDGGTNSRRAASVRSWCIDPRRHTPT